MDSVTVKFISISSLRSVILTALEKISKDAMYLIVYKLDTDID